MGRCNKIEILLRTANPGKSDIQCPKRNFRISLFGNVYPDSPTLLLTIKEEKNSMMNYSFPKIYFVRKLSTDHSW